MKITKNLPQFDRQRALIIVSGKSKVSFLFAHQGEIKEVGKLEVPENKYSDREGFFKTRTKTGGVIYSGSVLEDKKEEQRQKIKNKLGDKVKTLNSKYKITGLYLFAPDHLYNIMLSGIPVKMKKKMRGGGRGNYLKSKLLKFPKLIQDEREKKKNAKSKNMPREANKILKRSKKARRKIKGKP